MKSIPCFALALLLASSASGASQGTPDPHQAHHPAAAPAAGQMDAMQGMHQMHERMMAAKTPAEREALMREHLQAMQAGMAAMRSDSMPGPMNCDPGMREARMEHRMQMMEMMMQMMMDRMPPPKGK